MVTCVATCSLAPTHGVEFVVPGPMDLKESSNIFLAVVGDFTTQRISLPGSSQGTYDIHSLRTRR